MACRLAGWTTESRNLWGRVRGQCVCVYPTQCDDSVVSDSVRPHGLWPARILCPWDTLGKNTGVGRRLDLASS